MSYYNSELTEITALPDLSQSKVAYYLYFNIPKLAYNEWAKVLTMIISTDKTTYEYKISNSIKPKDIPLYSSISTYNYTTPNVPYYFKLVAKPIDEDFTEEEIQEIFESDDFYEYKSYYGNEGLGINVVNNQEIPLDYEFVIDISANNPIVDYYKIELYDCDNCVKLLESEELRPESDVSTNISYVFNNLEEDTVYTVRLFAYPNDGLRFMMYGFYKICTGSFEINDIFISNCYPYYESNSSWINYSITLDGNLNQKFTPIIFYYLEDNTDYVYGLSLQLIDGNKYILPISPTTIEQHTELFQPNKPYYIKMLIFKRGYVLNLSNMDFYFQKVLNKQPSVVYYIKKPTLSLNITDNQTVDTSGYTFILNYSQEDNEPLDYAIFRLYDSDNNLLIESEKLFNVEDPPLLVYKYFNGFLNNTSYKISAYVKTFHGLEVETNLINFNIEYENPILYAPLELENKCNDGYIDVSSDIFVGEGICNPSPMVFIDEGEKYSAYAIKSDPIIQYQRETSSWIYWNGGININTDFIVKCWFSVGTINNNILRLYNDEGNYLNIKFKRQFTNIELLNSDYVEISNDNGIVIANSNFINTRTNGTNKYFLWIKVVDNDWEVILSEYSKETSIFNWEDSNNNIQYNTTSDLRWYGEDYENNELRSPTFDANINNFNQVIIGNAVCRGLEITNNIELTYSDNFDNWDEYMVLKCDFNQNVKGGNLQEQLRNINSIRIKRFSKTTNTWITLYEKEIINEEDLIIDYKDYIVPNGIEQLYAIVPVLANGDEGNYVVNSITPSWNYCFVSDGEQCFKLYSSINYGTTPQNKPVGTLNPIGRTYPIIIRNSDINYKSGVLSGQLMGYNYEEYHHLDRADVVKQTQDYIDFLTNGKTKVITDWNGNCWVVQVIDSPTTNYNITTTNGITTVTFSWAEQGKYDNEKDLIENDLI